MFVELEKNSELSASLGWMEESSKAIGTMKRLLRRQLSFLLETIEKWNFDSFCKEVCRDTNIVTKYCPASGMDLNCCHTASDGYSCSDPFVKAHGKYSSLQFQCGASRLVFEGNWKVPEKVTWENLSPHD